MLKKERETEIVEILKRSSGYVTVKQLCSALYASESGIRRDLKALEQQGVIKRSYGGATLVGNFSNIVTFNNRIRQSSDAKRRIAKKAAALVKSGDVVFLDQSSTTFYLADELSKISSLTVVTNNVGILLLLADSDVKVISSGGQLSADNRSCLVGEDAVRTFEGVCADICFFSLHAVRDDGAAVDCSRDEVNVRRAMLHNADKTVLLCDSSKMGCRAPFKQCRIDDIDVLVTEDTAPFADFRDRIRLL